MNKDLDILFLETEIILNECDLGIYQDLMQDTFEYFSEASGSAPKESVFKKIIDRAKKMIADFIEKVKSFFAKKKTKDTIDKADKAFKANPKLKNAKLKVTDYGKLDKLTRATISKIVKNPDKADQIFEAYQKSKKLILGSTIAIGAGALLLKFKSMSNQISDYKFAIDEMSSLDAVAANKIDDLSSANKVLQDNNTALKNTIDVLRNDIADQNKRLDEYSNCVERLIMKYYHTDPNVIAAKKEFDKRKDISDRADDLYDKYEEKLYNRKTNGDISTDQAKHLHKVANKAWRAVNRPLNTAHNNYINASRTAIKNMHGKYIPK